MAYHAKQLCKFPTKKLYPERFTIDRATLETKHGNITQTPHFRYLGEIWTEPFFYPREVKEVTESIQVHLEPPQ